MHWKRWADLLTSTTWPRGEQMATAYIALQDLHQIFGEASVSKAVTQTATDIEPFLASINAEVDAYVGAAVPLPPTPAAIAVVRSAVADLARYRLNRDAASELMRTRAEDAIKFLQLIAARKLALPGPADDPDTPADESGLTLVSACGAAPRRMTRDQLRGW